MADTLITPINSSFVDIDLLGRFNPATMELLSPGYFTRLVNELRDERARRDLPKLDWVVMQNRARRGAKSHNQSRIDAALEQLAPMAGFRLGMGLAERVAYRELFLLGLTHLDIRHIPDLSAMRANARDEIQSLLDDLNLPMPGCKTEPVEAVQVKTAAQHMSSQLDDVLEAAVA